MSPEMNALTCLSLVGLLLALGLRAWRTAEWRVFLLQVGGLAVFVAFLNVLFGFPVPQTVVGKGATEDWMLAIAFIPLLASFEGAGINLRNSPSPRLMIFLVAFQNGFFWKEYFDSRKKK